MSYTQHIDEIKAILKRAGLTDNQITSYLLDLDTRLQACVIDDYLKQLSREQQVEFEKMVKNNVPPHELAHYLELNKEDLQLKIEGYVKKFTEETRRQYPPPK